MSLLVLAFPEISESDFNFIQEFRKKNDRHYSLFPPHFTIVFPAFGIEEEEFTEHVINKTKNCKKIDFTLNCAVSVKDFLSEYRDVFLIPDKGNSAIVKLHDALYTGILITHLRLDIPFMPHMNIGNDVDQFHCINLANELNAQDISIQGTISRLSIARYDGSKLDIITDILLS